MNIYVISSDQKTSRFLTAAIQSYSEQKYVEITVKVFRRIREYLADFDKPDLIFIDDNVEMKPSVENARIVRGKDSGVAIVLLSTNPEKVFEAFTVKTHRFLTKPITQNDIFDAIDSYRKDLFSGKGIIAKVDNAFRIFSSEEVYALIADGSRPKIMTRDEVIEVLTPFNRIMTQLPEEYFFRCHRSYVVNMKYIAKFDAEQIELTNHSIVPISRRKRMDFHMNYAEFVKGHTFQS